MNTNKPIPTLQVHQLAWIFNAAREHFSEEVRNLQLEIIRLREFSESGPLAESSWVSRRKNSGELLEERRASIERLLPVIEFCDAMREHAANKSSEEFAKAFKECVKRRNTDQ